MADKVSFELDAREFTETLKRFAPLTKRALPELVNKKLLYISRGASRDTPKADIAAIKAELGKIVKRKGGGRVLKLVKAALHPISLVEAILRARYKRQGLPQPSADEMPELIAKELNSRFKSVGYLKSGYIPGIKLLAAAIGQTAGLRGVNYYGKPHGSAAVAKEGWSVRASITNSATSRDPKQPLILFGAGPLQANFDKETRSTAEEIEKRLAKAARDAGIQLANAL